jgi:hypothetical protein
MDAERFIDTLKREQAQLALDSLRNPRGRDAFELGLLSGLVQAYARMQTFLEEHLAEAEGRPKSEQRPARVANRNPYLAELDSAPVLPEQMGRRG